MAKYNKGILGGFSGKVGNVVGSSWKGIDYMRSKPNKVHDPKTEAQMTQRQKFRLVMAFLRRIKPVITRGFLAGSKQMNPVNRASSYNLKNAVTGTYPDQELDFSSVLVSRGDLLAAQGISAESVDPNELAFSWTDNSGIGSAQSDDEGLILVYQPETEKAIYVASGGPERQEESYTLNLPDSYGGEEVEVWFAFVSADGKEASDSEYLGSITIQEQTP